MMKRAWPKILPMLLGLWFAGIGVALAQPDNAAKVNQMLVESYDLLEAGKLDQAKAVFAEILKLEPGNPLALNNLGAVLVKEKKYAEALKSLKQAQVRARTYKVKVNRVCAVDEVCLAFRPAEPVYGDTPLLPLILMNIEMVRARMATRE